MVRCPCHEDSKNSLSIGLSERGNILMYCHAGCRTEDILEAKGLTMRDLYNGETETAHVKQYNNNFDFSNVEAEYYYGGDSSTASIRKRRDKNKNFIWEHRDFAGNWKPGRNNAPHELYKAGTEEDIVIVVEGEKDADNLSKLGFYCVSSENGAGANSTGKKWYKEYSNELQGKTVYIIADQDDIGRTFADTVEAELQGIAASVTQIDLSAGWPEIPKHGDVSNMIDALGSDATYAFIHAQLASDPKRTTVEPKPCLPEGFKTLDQIQEETPEWFIPNIMPKGAITVFAADGGVGKTCTWCDIISKASRGKGCILDPDGHKRNPATALVFAAEDSASMILKPKLRQSGCDMSKVIIFDQAAGEKNAENQMKFGSKNLIEAIRNIKPDICVFDPIQAYLPSGVQMAMRNEMRNCLQPLLEVCRETGTAILIVVHTNKREKAYARSRISDSADIWDIARSVIMGGKTSDSDISYISHEKSNYGPMQDTVLFCFREDGTVEKCGTSKKKDEQFQSERHKREDKLDGCVRFILNSLTGGPVFLKDLEEETTKKGYSSATLRRAKEKLREERKIHIKKAGGNWIAMLAGYKPDVETAQMDLLEPSRISAP